MESQINGIVNQNNFAFQQFGFGFPESKVKKNLNDNFDIQEGHAFWMSEMDHTFDNLSQFPIAWASWASDIELIWLITAIMILNHFLALFAKPQGFKTSSFVIQYLIIIFLVTTCSLTNLWNS